MKSNFETAFRLVIGSEGGYQNDYEDRGNWTGGKVGRGERLGTKYGITAMNYSSYDIPNLTEEQAKEIYYEDYWKPIMADDLPVGIDYMAFDIAINHGKEDSIRFTQEAVETAVDGIVGPNTLAAVEAAEPLSTLGAMQRIRQYDYTSLGTWGSYGKGWSRRNANVTEEALTMLAESLRSSKGAAGESVAGGLFRRV